jgi:hypothetical protein
MSLNQLNKLAATIPVQPVAVEEEDSAVQVAATENGRNQAFRSGILGKKNRDSHSK